MPLTEHREENQLLELQSPKHCHHSAWNINMWEVYISQQVKFIQDGPGQKHPRDAKSYLGSGSHRQCKPRPSTKWWRHKMESFSTLLALSVNSPHKGQWRRTLMFPLICAWTNGWVNTRDADDSRSHRVRYDPTVMKWHQGAADSIRRWHLTGIGNLIVEIRRSYDRLISTVGSPMLVRWHLLHWIRDLRPNNDS